MDNKQLWVDNKEYKPLRRPNTNSHCVPNNKSLNDKKGETSEATATAKDFNDILNKSQLRVDAEEWFPSSYSQTTNQLICNTQQQPAQSRLQKIRIENTTTDDENTDPSLNNPMYFDPVNLDILIQSLIYDPGQFDNLVDNFLGILEPHFDNVDVAIQTAEAIFGYALKEPSFRYNAARLCCLIDEHYPLFRPRLHTLCQKELNSDKQRQGLTLFLAELYMQLHYETVYGRCLLDSLKKLISSKKPDDIKSACQALKLAGYSLESNSKELDEMFKDLESSIPTLQQSTANLVESIFILRKNNWGRSTAPTNNDSTPEQNGVTVTSLDEDCTYYGPDGKEMTPEEQDFLSSNYDDADSLGDDPDDLYNPEPEMDKEIQEAFREFVRMGKR